MQTIEGLRLNNLCAQGARTRGVYWNDASFEEFSYVTGADSAEVGQGGMRVNMVPRDGGNSFRGSAIVNYAGEDFRSDNCGSPGSHGLRAARRSNLSGSKTFNPNNTLDQRRRDPEDLGRQSVRSADRSSRTRSGSTTRSGTGARPRPKPTRYVRQEPLAVRLRARYDQPGVDDGHIVSNAGRISWQVSGKDKISVYHDERSKATAITGASPRRFHPRPPACRSRPPAASTSRSGPRTHTNKLLLEGGFGYYNQEYTELYQPSGDRH